MKNIDKVAFPGLLKDLQDIALNKRAEAVMNRCIRNKKYALAMKIAAKYNIQRQKYCDDTVMSLGLAAIASKNSIHPST